MVLDSIAFIFRFLPIFLLCYYVAPGRTKNFVLILGSLIFCAWGEPGSILVVLVPMCADFFFGRLIGANREKNAAKVYLVFSVFLNVTMFGVGIYTFRSFSKPFVMTGIAVYVLKAMSYTIDVYKGEVKPQKNILDYLTYLTFFPQFPGGPVVRYRELEGELHSRKIDICTIYEGAVKFIEGLAKKVLIADNIGRVWENISYLDTSRMSMATAWLGILAFSLKIYFVFSGYSDMGEGIAAIFGFTYPRNFHYPYAAASVTDFWRRWYISLGNWFRNYIYEPIAGSEGKLYRNLAGIFVSMAFIGLWSGFGWNFLCWGLWFAAFLMIERIFLKKILDFLPVFAGRIYTWVIVLIGWVIFTGNDFQSVVLYLTALFGGNGAEIFDRQSLFLLAEYKFFYILAVVFCTPAFNRISLRLKRSGSGIGISVYRLFQKVFVGVVFLLVLVYMVGK